MPNVKISELTATGTVTDADLVEVSSASSGGTFVSHKSLLSTVASYIIGKLNAALDAMPLTVARGGTGGATQAAGRTGLGLGTIATQDASGVIITGGSVSGIIDLAVADGGTGASTAGAARSNLGLGTAAMANTGTSGATVPLLNTVNTWSASQIFGVNASIGGTYTSALVPSGVRAIGSVGIGYSWDAGTVSGANSRNFAMITNYNASGVLELMGSSAAGGAPTDIILKIDKIANLITFYAGTSFNGSLMLAADNSYSLGSSANRFATNYSVQLRPGDGTPIWTSGAGVPNIVAQIGSLYTRTDGGSGSTFYVKESGNGSAAGWIAK